ncbi:hypothetical protein [Halovivax cerinus]|uniref:Uncharacterized protein n=1 Tax=Halovivax cerinus TaxID=1487865 RepID=A0ABD5NN88_9EURY|nr:hypothetical protein [Halovivax cerinus]
MSAVTTVRVSKDQAGRFTATDTETGDSADGATQADALATLAGRRATDEDDASSVAECISRTQAVRRRFEDEGVTEADVDEAIEWARSE